MGHTTKYKFDRIFKGLDILNNPEITNFLNRIKDYRDWSVEIAKDREYYKVIRVKNIQGKEVNLGIIKTML